MLKRSGAKPDNTRETVLSEEEIKKILGEDDCEKRIPDSKIILKKHQESKKNGNLMKSIFHQNLLNKIESNREY